MDLMARPEKSMWLLQTRELAAQAPQDPHAPLVNYECFPSKFLNDLRKLLSLFAFPR